MRPIAFTPGSFEVVRDKKRIRMKVNDFAIPRMPEGQQEPLNSKEEIRKIWEPLFVAELAQGRDPRIPPPKPGRAAHKTSISVATFFERFYAQHYVANGCRSLPAARSRIKQIIEGLGSRPVEELQHLDVIEEFRGEYAEGRETATVNGVLEVIRSAVNWGLRLRRVLGATDEELFRAMTRGWAKEG